MRPTPIRLASAVSLALLLTGCQKNLLDVPNLNNPDVARAYSSASGVESVILGTFKQLWNAVNNCSDCVNTQGHLMALEAFSELNNFGMGQRAAIPRNTVSNDRGNGQAGANRILGRRRPVSQASSPMPACDSCRVTYCWLSLG